MCKSSLIRLMNELYQIKLKQSFGILDCHVHPFDVMGVKTDLNSGLNHLTKSDFLRPQLSELLNYNLLSNKLTDIFTNYFPKFTSKFIDQIYSYSGIRRILAELDSALVDRCILLPIEPWVKVADVYAKFNMNNRFIIFGSFDLNESLEMIERKSAILINEYHISGIKLHPNLQNFFPNPENNDTILKDKIDYIYRFSEENNLPILFHCGTSFYQNLIDPIFKGQTRSRSKALLSNFCDSNGIIEFLERYKLNIILAHASAYGLNTIDCDRIKKMSTRYNSVYFDTSGVSPSRIRELLRIVDYKYVIFGSDALYNRVAYNVAFTFQAIKNYVSEEKREDELSEICKYVFQENILRLIKFQI